jgi:hypothetical protein
MVTTNNEYKSIKINQMNKLDMLHTLSISELIEIKKQIQTMIDLKQPTLFVGDKVTVNHPRVKGKIFTIVKINKVKMKLKDSTGATWKTPKHMVSIAPGATMQIS